MAIDSNTRRRRFDCCRFLFHRAFAATFATISASLDKDFPIKLQKPVDTPYGPYADGFSLEQHKYGPFDPIRAKVRELLNASK